MSSGNNQSRNAAKIESQNHWTRTFDPLDGYNGIHFMVSIKNQMSPAIISKELLHLEQENESSSVHSPEHSTTSITTSSHIDSTSTVPPTQKPNICRIDVSSDILSKVKSFLPHLKSENQKLWTLIQQNPEKKGELAVDNVEDHETTFVEMDVGLGVFDVKGSIPQQGNALPEVDLPESEEVESELTPQSVLQKLQTSKVVNKSQKQTLITELSDSVDQNSDSEGSVNSD